MRMTAEQRLASVPSGRALEMYKYLVEELDENDIAPDLTVDEIQIFIDLLEARLIQSGDMTLMVNSKAVSS